MWTLVQVPAALVPVQLPAVAWETVEGVLSSWAPGPTGETWRRLLASNWHSSVIVAI